MKARVIATGEIVEISTFQDNNKFPTTYNENELEFFIPDDYWTHLEHQYAGMAMQGILAHRGLECKDYIPRDAMNIAHVLVEKYKKEEK